MNTHGGEYIVPKQARGFLGFWENFHECKLGRMALPKETMDRIFGGTLITVGRPLDNYSCLAFYYNGKLYGFTTRDGHETSYLYTLGVPSVDAQLVSILRKWKCEYRMMAKDDVRKFYAAAESRRLERIAELGVLE